MSGAAIGGPATLVALVLTYRPILAMRSAARSPKVFWTYVLFSADRSGAPGSGPRRICNRVARRPICQPGRPIPAPARTRHWNGAVLQDPLYLVFDLTAGCGQTDRPARQHRYCVFLWCGAAGYYLGISNGRSIAAPPGLTRLGSRSCAHDYSRAHRRRTLLTPLPTLPIRREFEPWGQGLIQYRSGHDPGPRPRSSGYPPHLLGKPGKVCGFCVARTRASPDDEDEPRGDP